MLFRRLALISILLLTCRPAMAERPPLPDPPRIDVPETFPPHPRLFINQKEIDALKAWAKRDKVVGEYVDAFITRSLAEIDTITLPGPKSGDHNRAIAGNSQRLAVAYVLSDKIELAEAAGRILTAYIEHVPNYRVSGLKGRVTSSALGEAAWATSAACAYDLIYNSGVLTDEQKQGIEQDVLKLSAEALRTCNHAGRSNWRMIAVAGFGSIGFCIGDRDLIDEALNGVRDETGKLKRDGFGHHVAWSMLDDGMYYERSLGYTTYVSSNYPYLLEAARHSGVDLWNMKMPGDEWGAGADPLRRFGPTGPRTIKGLFDAPFYRTMGDYSQVTVANVGSPSLTPKWFHEAAWRAYGDPKYAWLVHRGRKGRLPNNPVDLIWMSPEMTEGRFDLGKDATIGVTGRHTNACTLLPNGGLTILRQNGSSNAAAVLMTYGLWGSSHCHADQLSITLYAAEYQFIPEPKYFKGYGHKKFLSWDRQTIAHNTVTVDEISQDPQGDKDSPWVAPAPGRAPYSQPTLFHAGDKLKAFRAVCAPGRAYEGVTLDRTIAMVGSVVVDFYRCRSDREHQYDFSLHVDGQLAGSSVELGDAQAGPLADKLGYRHIVDLRRVALDEGVAELTYTRDNGVGPQLHLSFLPTGEGELIVGKGITGDHGRQADAVIVRKRAANAD
ncbi:MAG TPA: hypothetical protein ENH78_11440, partial [Phycisphaerae bacterium]|nr:hypothetical protein [Phycisphaerae bacterium]